MFPLLHQDLLSCDDLGSIYPLILQGHFRDYFHELENIHLKWVRDPFAPGVGSSLVLKSQNEMIELEFEALSLSKDWLHV